MPKSRVMVRVWCCIFWPLYFWKCDNVWASPHTLFKVSYLDKEIWLLIGVTGGIRTQLQHTAKLAQFSIQFIATWNRLNKKSQQSKSQKLQKCTISTKVHNIILVVSDRRQVALPERRQKGCFRNRHSWQQVIKPGNKAGRSFIGTAKTIWQGVNEQGKFIYWFAWRVED